MRQLEELARSLGSDRIGLDVWMDNPGAIALYSRLGFTASSMAMTKPLAPAAADPKARSGTGTPRGA